MQICIEKTEPLLGPGSTDGMGEGWYADGFGGGWIKPGFVTWPIRLAYWLGDWGKRQLGGEKGGYRVGSRGSGARPGF